MNKVLSKAKELNYKIAGLDNEVIKARKEVVTLSLELMDLAERQKISANEVLKTISGFLLRPVLHNDDKLLSLLYNAGELEKGTNMSAWNELKLEFQKLKSSDF